MRKFQVALRLATLSVLQLIALARNYVTKTTGNAEVPIIPATDYGSVRY